jgi:hypothetical protein
LASGAELYASFCGRRVWEGDERSNDGFGFGCDGDFCFGVGLKYDWTRKWMIDTHLVLENYLEFWEGVLAKESIKGNEILGGMVNDL